MSPRSHSQFTDDDCMQTSVLLAFRTDLQLQVLVVPLNTLE